MSVRSILDWKRMQAHDLEHRRCIIRTKNGSVIDTFTSGLRKTAPRVDPDQYELHIDAREAMIDRTVIMFINTRTGERKLNPDIRDLIIHELPVTKSVTVERK